jgi:hypothetical protein
MKNQLLEIMTKAALGSGYRLFHIGELGYQAHEVLAVPWVKGASSAERLIAALAESIALQSSDVHPTPDGAYGRTVHILNCHMNQFLVNVMPRYTVFRIAMSADLADN